MNVPDTTPDQSSRSRPHVPTKIVSGGQTGVDRGALDAAMRLGIDHGGWCPAGRLAEDGRVPDQYQLVELESRYYPDRTLQNILDSDATLILYRGKISGGTSLTQRLCRREHRPCLAIAIDRPTESVAAIHDWLDQIRPMTLNVAGPRESNAQGIHEDTRALLMVLLG